MNIAYAAIVHLLLSPHVADPINSLLNCFSILLPPRPNIKHLALGNVDVIIHTLLI